MVREFCLYALIISVSVIGYWWYHLVWLDLVSNNNEVEIHFLDVGQGDSILIETPKGKKVLVDAGRGVRVIPVLEQELSPTEKTIDIVVLTHPDADHIGGFIPVFDRFAILNSIRSFISSDTNVYRQVINAIEKEGESYVVSERYFFELDGLIFHVLWPLSKDISKTNTASVVLLVKYGDTEILLTGDAPISVEKELISRFPVLLKDIDILKVGHHGSKTSTSEEFLEYTEPNVLVYSAAAQNRYNHPNKEVVNRVNEYVKSHSEQNAKIYETKDGTVSFCISRYSFKEC